LLLCAVALPFLTKKPPPRPNLRRAQTPRPSAFDSLDTSPATGEFR